MPLVWLSAGFQSLPHYPQANWAFLVLIPGWVGLCTFQDPVGHSKELLCETGSFSCCCTSHRFFQSGVLRLYFPVLEPWVVWSVSLPSCSSQFIHMQAWDCPLHQPPPQWESSLPSCLSPPLLPVWMNVSSLGPWLSDFHTI